MTTGRERKTRAPWSHQRASRLSVLGLVALLWANVPAGWAFAASRPPRLPNFDKRQPAQPPSPGVAAEQAADVARLQATVPGVRVDFDDLLESPKIVGSTRSFLTAAIRPGRSDAGLDPDRPTKMFLDAHRALFGHGPEALAAARVKREFVTAHNGLRTVVWEQQLDGIPVFEALLVAHTTRHGELVSLSSHFVPDPERAARRGTPDRAALLAAPPVSARRAVVLAARNLGATLEDERVTAVAGPAPGAERRQRFQAAALKGASDARLVWLPMSQDALRLCWEVVLTSRARHEMFRVLVDAQTGEPLVRRGLTEHLSDATYRVFTGESPSPLSPGWPTPLTNQPPLVARTLVTLAALDTNASPAGWIADGGNETRGNNVDAYLDRNADDQPDLPRPQGAPFRVFDFPLDLTQSPTNYGVAAVVELFYWCNWMHDQLYDLGFTEAAGNFQTDNFGRGGQGNDALLAEAQDGGGFNNSNMSTPADGSPPRLEMYLFNGATPSRDSDLDAQVIVHEYTHGLSNRRVGGGAGLYELQSEGLGEGWSDFYSLALLTDPGADPAADYPQGGYVSRGLQGLQQNFYFGIRRYPYTTDLTRNPLTFKDIDPTQASPHAGVLLSPRFASSDAPPADDIHNQGEVWCVALWEARANLIRQYGAAAGNQLLLQLVTDGMNLAPANPNFLEARDALLQADLVDNAGTNQPALWAAFAKRGLGFSAVSPSSVTTVGVREAFDLPDNLLITPNADFVSIGPVGGPFTPAVLSLTLTNLGTNLLTWTAAGTSVWLRVFPAGGILPPGAATNATLALDTQAAGLPAGVYDDLAWFTNQTSGVAKAWHGRLRIGQPDSFTQLFANQDNDVAYQSFTFTPDGSAGFYTVCRAPATQFFTDPTGGTAVTLGDDDFAEVTLPDTNTIGLYGQRTNGFFIGSNGYLTLDQGDTARIESLATHFRLPRVSGLFDDLYPPAGGSISWKELGDRVAVTWLGIWKHGTAGNPNNFQIELFFDGRIRLTYLALGDTEGLIGLSRGQGIPYGFLGSDFTAYPLCPLPFSVALPPRATEGDGLLAGQGQVAIPAAVATNQAVNLASSNPRKVTVPSSVTIPAGQTNAAFDLTVLDDRLLDGTQPVTITASAPGWLDGSATMLVDDAETATLAVGLPAAVIEGAGTTQGVVSVSAPPAVDVSIALSSSDTNHLLVPPVVLIPAGQTSAQFTVTLPDDFAIDGPQTVTVTAHEPNWTDGAATVTVLDAENLNLTVTLPAQAWEGAGTLPGGGAVGLSGTLLTNLVVTLVASDTNELVVPAVVTIPAGQTSSPFDLLLPQDWDLDGNLRVTVTASAPGFTNGAAVLLILDSDWPPAPGLSAPAFQPGMFSFQFATVPGHNYVIEFKTTLDDPLWQMLEIVAGDGTVQTVSDPFATDTQRFYRVRVQ